MKRLAKLLSAYLVLAIVTMGLPLDFAPDTALAAAKITLQSGKEILSDVTVDKKYDLKVAGTAVYFYSSDKAVASIGKATGRMTVHAPGNVTITAKSKKSGKTVATKKFTARQRAAEIMTDVDVLCLSELGGTATIGVTLTPANSTDDVIFISSDKEIATVGYRSGVVTAKWPGEATIKIIARRTSTTKTNDRGNITKTVTVQVGSKLNGAAQTAKNAVRLSFTAGADDTLAKPNLYGIKCDETSVTIPIQSAVLNKDKTVTLTTYTDITDGKTYTVTGADGTASFTATRNEAAKIYIEPVSIPFGTPTEIFVVCEDINGVRLSRDPINALPDRISGSINETDGALSGATLTLNAEGGKATCNYTLKDERYQDTVASTGDVVITGYEPETAYTNIAYSVSDSGMVDFGAANYRQSVFASNGKASLLCLKISNDNGDVCPNLDGYTFETSDVNILTVGAKQGMTVVLQGVRKGTANVLVRSASDGTPVATLPITVRDAPEPATLDTQSKTIELQSAETNSQHVQMVYGVFDQYGEPYRIESLSDVSLGVTQSQYYTIQADVKDGKLVLDAVAADALKATFTSGFVFQIAGVTFAFTVVSKKCPLQLTDSAIKGYVRYYLDADKQTEYAIAAFGLSDGKYVITPVDNPVRDGYTFVKWEYTANGEPVTVPGGLDSVTSVDAVASWRKTTYPLTYQPENANGNTIYNLAAGDKIPAAPQNLARTGYTFSGWVWSVNGVTVPQMTTMPAGAVYAKAVWTKNSYTISFDTQGGSKIEPITFRYNEEVRLPDNPTREGYDFRAWSSDSWNVPTVMPAQNVKLTAVWEAKNYKVTYETGTTASVAPVYRKVGDQIDLPTNITRVGYAFAGWTWQGSTAPETMPASDVTLTAKWTPIDYALRVDYNGGTGKATDTTLHYGDAIALPKDAARDGYDFIAWQENGKDAPATMPDRDVTLTAVWKARLYTITFDTAGGGAIAPVTLTFGAKVALPGDPSRAGYAFTGWKWSTGKQPVTMPASNLTATAIWDANEYTVTYDTDGGTYVAPAKARFGDAVPIPAGEPEKAGYRFKGWMYNGGYDLPKTMPASDVTLTADWAVAEYVIIFETGEGGTRIPEIRGKAGAAYTMPANPTREGYVFDGWTWDCGAQPATIPAKNVQATAKWIADVPYTITFDSNGGSAVAQIMAKYGAKITLPANPTKTGCDFLSWLWDCGVAPVTMPAKNVKATAQWKARTYSVTYTLYPGKMETRTFAYGDPVTKPTVPYRSGYEFVGWAWQKNGSEIAAPATMPDANLTAVAIWYNTNPTKPEPSASPTKTPSREPSPSASPNQTAEIPVASPELSPTY